jgi:hypothetical protein
LIGCSDTKAPGGTPYPDRRSLGLLDEIPADQRCRVLAVRRDLAEALALSLGRDIGGNGARSISAGSSTAGTTGIGSRSSSTSHQERTRGQQQHDPDCATRTIGHEPPFAATA